MSDYEAIRNVLADYCFGTDAGDIERWLGAMTEDVVWEGGPFGRFQGHAAGREYHKAGDPTAYRHLTLNSMIRVDGDQAVAHSYVVLFQQGETLTPAACLFYEDSLRKEGGRWRIARRVIHTSPAELPAKL